MADGRKSPFEHWFVQHRAALRRYVLRFVGSRDTADDIVQETFLRACAQRVPTVFPKAFLFTIAHNLSMNWLRSRRSAATDPMGDMDAVGVYMSEQLDDSLIAEEELRLLQEAVEQLPSRCRAAFALRVFHAQPYTAIARELGISAKTVEKHISRGLRETHAYLRRRYALSAERGATPLPSQRGGARAEGEDG